MTSGIIFTESCSREVNILPQFTEIEKNNFFFKLTINTKGVFNRDTHSQHLQKKPIEI